MTASPNQSRETPPAYNSAKVFGTLHVALDKTYLAMVDVPADAILDMRQRAEWAEAMGAIARASDSIKRIEHEVWQWAGKPLRADRMTGSQGREGMG